MYNKKICRIYTILPENDQHQSMYNYINLQVFFDNCVNLRGHYIFHLVIYYLGKDWMMFVVCE